MRSGRDYRESGNKEVQIVKGSSSSSSPVFSVFKLPRDWVVENRPSATVSGRVDKYYHNPETGEKFRSLVAVQRYLKGEPVPARSRSGRNMPIVPYSYKTTSAANLPDNWIVAEKPRTDANYTGIIDREYIDTETGPRYRSMRAVERFLAEMDEDSITLQEIKEASHLAKKSNSRKNHFLQVVSKCPENATAKKRHKAGEGRGPSTSIPTKVKWVLGGPGGNTWKPFLGEYKVPESETRKWSKTFVLSIQE